MRASIIYKPSCTAELQAPGSTHNYYLADASREIGIIFTGNLTRKNNGV